MGGLFTYHFGRAAANAKPGEGPRRSGGSSYRLSVPDSDRDGVGDDQDLCRNVAQGEHPDPFKPGCPENDEDGDGVPDVDDACPVSLPGDNPDPKRPGCPLVDTDKDGIADPDDQCPLKPGPATADPAHNGCPEKGKKGAVEEEGAPPPSQSPDAPSTVRKRSRAQEVARGAPLPNPLPAIHIGGARGFDQRRGRRRARAANPSSAAPNARWVCPPGVLVRCV